MATTDRRRVFSQAADMGMVVEGAALYPDELLIEWQKASNAELIGKIDPLP